MRQYDAVLFDLDGTLIGLEVETFIPAYFEQVTRHFASAMEPEQFLRRLKAGTRAMLESQNPDSRNRDEFEAVFFDGIAADIQPCYQKMFADFYREEFPRLQHLCRPVDQAPDLLADLRARGVRVALATNPVFPRAAIEHRLSWGGLEASAFEYISSYENSSFCKPHAGYYQEILDRLSLDADRTLMVGNDPVEDLSAQKAGIATYLVNHYNLDRGEAGLTPTYSGSLSDVFSCVFPD